MKVVLGIDESPYSTATVAFVCRMTWPRGTTFVVASALAPTEPQYAPEPSLVASVAGNIGVIEDRAVRLREDVIGRAEQSLRAAGLEARGLLLYGDPRQAIVNAAQNEQAELVIVGSHGSPARRVLGSVATYLTAHAPCSVMVVKGD